MKRAKREHIPVSKTESSHEHCIHDAFSNITTSFLPPNMTSVLQPVDAAIGRSVKAAFRRVLVRHVIEHLKELRRTGSTFMLQKAVTTYDGVLLMKRAWDMVSKSVVLNGWLTCNILAPHQKREIKRIKEDSGDEVENAKKSLRGGLFENDKVLNESRRTEAERSF